MINQEALAKAIKPLVWETSENGDLHWAKQPYGAYHIEEIGRRTPAGVRYYLTPLVQTYKSLDDAKAAAQADYVARLLSAFNIEALPHVDRAGVLPEQYALGLIAEEAGEVLQWVGKSLRFGFDTPGRRDSVSGEVTGETPRDLMPPEIGDLLAAIEFAAAHGLIDRTAVEAAKARKLQKLLDPASLDNLGRPLAPQPAVNTSPEGVGGTGNGELRKPIEWAAVGAALAALRNALAGADDKISFDGLATIADGRFGVGDPELVASIASEALAARIFIRSLK